MQRLIFIRHGETKINVDNKLHRINDPEPLSKIGIQQTKKAARKLKELNPDIIFASQEKRALQSAKIIADCINIPLQIIEGLEERNWGDYSGKTWAEIQEVLDTMSLDDRYKFIPPNGESWRKAEKRLVTAIKKIVGDQEYKTSIIVTHGGSVRILMPFLLNKQREESFKYNPDNAEVIIFDYENDHFKKISIDI